MSVLSPKRVLFPVLATAFLAVSAFAVNPSPRDHAEMVFDSQAAEMILFGGTSAFDIGTQTAYESNETWAWTGTRWVQRFPAHSPSARSAQAMAYDSIRGRVVLFGGRFQTGTGSDRTLNLLGDMWVYEDGDWRELTPSTAPSARNLSAMAFDPLRDRIILYGGSELNATKDGAVLKYDTWEFDGTNWTQVNNDQVKVGNPMLAYDSARDQMILVGSDTEAKPHMYRYDPTAKTWIEITPEKMPACANDAAMVYQSHNRTLLLSGGVCAASDSFTDKTWEWNGTTWAEVTTIAISRTTGAAMAYDPLRETTVRYGGTEHLDPLPRSVTMIYNNRQWRFAVLHTRPSPRSLFSMISDPVNNTVWVYGGMGEYNNAWAADLWGYRNGQWFVKTAKNPPASCIAAMGAYDTARSKTVFVCWPDTGLEMEVYEFDGTEFKAIAVDNDDDKPEGRRFGALVYDETLKKTVLFGGYDSQDFRDDTWLWDGTKWTEVTKNKPPNRGLHAMWYDPLQKRVILYGGIGREDIEEHVERFQDMWAFTGSGWTNLNISNTPGRRLGPQYAVDPASGKLLLFGGLVHEITDPEKETGRVFYDNQTWQWDGAANSWTRLEPANSPAARQNGRMAYDPASQRLTLFAGYAGLFFSDVWTWNGSNWEPRPETGGGRRRSVSPAPGPQTPATVDLQ